MPLKKIHSSWRQFVQSYLLICTVQRVQLSCSELHSIYGQ